MPNSCKVFEVVVTTQSHEIHHVKAHSHEEAIEKHVLGHSRHYTTYSGATSEPEVEHIEGPWQCVEDYEAQYGKLLEYHL